MRRLVIFDRDGRVYAMQLGVEKIPKGLSAVFAEVPEHFTSVSMDMETKTPIFNTEEPTEEPTEDTAAE